MTDQFKDRIGGLESPAAQVYAISPNDSVDLPLSTRALNVASAGAIRVTTITGDTDTIYVAAGIAFPVRVSRVWQTGTTATGIVALV